MNDCNHPLAFVKKKGTNYYCLKCIRKVEGFDFIPCNHQYKKDHCSLCKKEQKVVADFLK